MTQEKIVLLNGKSLDLHPLHIDVAPCEDINLFAANAWLILANAEMIFSDSRLFLSPIDMHCGVAYSGKFHATTLGTYVEWWLRHPQSRDADGYPVIRLSGSPLSGCNKCTSATPGGKAKQVVLRGSFNMAFRTFLQVGGRYKEYIGKYEAYPLEKVIAILKGEGVTDEVIELRTANEQLRAQLHNIRCEQERLKQYLKEQSDTYLRAILAPHIQECKTLYRQYRDMEEYFYGTLCELRRPKHEAKQRLKRGEITQEVYRAICSSVHEAINQGYEQLDAWWTKHMTQLYLDNARFFTPQNIEKYLTPNNEEKK